ncbi:MAG TPA: alpha/beta fold hydrolase [Pyrinomonadaceae bacterium]|nr:alpha/beta fold hydrolase [Pyrinomonadaceae bacterium]
MTQTSFLRQARPYTHIEPVVEVHHGIPVTDPYRWLEEDSERTRRWIETQTIYARSYLDRISGRERIAKRIEELLTVDVISTPIKIGNRFFFLKRSAHADYPVICMREGDDGEDECLVDLRSSNHGPGASMNIAGISNDAKLLAYGVRRGGEDSISIEILDVDNRSHLDDGLPHGFGHGLVFAGDSRSYYYVHEMSGAPKRHAVYQHVLGSQGDREVFFAGDDPNTTLGIWRLSDRYVAYWVTRIESRVTSKLYMKDLLNDEPAWLIVDDVERPFIPYVLGDQIVALTTWQAPNGKIVSFGLDSPDRQNWREIVPEREWSIKSFVTARDRLLVSYNEQMLTRTDIYNLSGEKLGTLPDSGAGSVKVYPGSPDSDEVFYEFTSFKQPPTTYRYDINTQQQRLWAQKRVPVDTSLLSVTQVEYVSKDKSRVPMVLVRNGNVEKSRNTPTILTAYGGFGASMTPAFKSYLALLIEKGCLVAIPNIRGGSELGRAWHLAGKRRNRQTAFDDFIAAAEWLISNDYTSRDRLAIVGGSNGGLLVAAALTQRPDLFRAVVCVGPLLDMLRYHRFDSARAWIDEYGSADDPEDFAPLLAYSPYHNVREDTAYPAVLFISGDADTRCNALHVRKMTAILQARSVSDAPILMEYRKLRGHRAGLPLKERIEALTDRVAFICDQLNIAI